MNTQQKQDTVQQKYEESTQIFELNLKFKAALQLIDYDYLTISHFRLKVDLIHRNTICAQSNKNVRLSRVRFGWANMKELVELLDSDDVLKVHQGLVGISNLRIRNYDEGEELMQTGIVSKLLYVSRRWHEYFLLNVHSISLLCYTALNIRNHNFRDFLDQNILPDAFFAEVLNFRHQAIKQAYQLMRILKRCGRIINTSDTNISFLNKIEDIILVKQDKQTLRIAIRILYELSPQDTITHKKFTNKLYKINRIILQTYRKNNLIKEIEDMFDIIRPRQLLRLFKFIKNDQDGMLSEIEPLLRELLDTFFEQGINTKSEAFPTFMEHFFLIDEKYCPFSHLELFERTLLILLAQNKQKHTCCWRSVNACLNIIHHLLMDVSFSLLNSILRSQHFLNHLVMLYSCRNSKMNQNLNIIICSFITQAYKGRNTLVVLKEYFLIPLYFQNCVKYSKRQIKNAFQLMRMALLNLKQKSENYYDLVRSEVIKEQNMAIVNKYKRKIKGMKSIYSFYQKLKEGKDSFPFNSIERDLPSQQRQEEL